MELLCGNTPLLYKRYAVICKSAGWFRCSPSRMREVNSFPADPHDLLP
jgi:hypothetical protein